MSGIIDADKTAGNLSQDVKDKLKPFDISGILGASCTFVKGLLNAVYLERRWEYKFEKEITQNDMYFSEVEL